MRCLNRQRANIVFSSILHQGSVLSPTEVSQYERVFERDGVLRWVDDCVIGQCQLGVPLEVLLATMGHCHQRTGSVDLHAIKLSELLDVFANEAYILWFADGDYEAIVVLKEGCTPIDQLKAWTHALMFAQRLRTRGIGRKPKDDDAILELGRLDAMRTTLDEASELFVKYVSVLKQKGWDLDVTVLETRAGVRTHLSVPHKK